MTHKISIILKKKWIFNDFILRIKICDINPTV